MAELPTMEVHSWKDPAQKWIINAADYDPAIHVRWGDLMPGPYTGPKAESVPPEERVHIPHRPSAPDFIMDEQGNTVSVNIINPEHRQARKEIPYGEYDPVVHELWSTHNRFQ